MDSLGLELECFKMTWTLMLWKCDNLGKKILSDKTQILQKLVCKVRILDFNIVLVWA